MIRKILFIVLIGFLFSCSNKQEAETNTKKADGSPPKIEFEQLYYDFGKIIEGEKVSYTFSFKNSGGSELIIKDAIASCGCTVPEYEKRIIKPGEEGSIEVIFDSSGRMGNQYKSIILRTNTPYGEKTLTIKAKVVTNKN
jgi:hypothetical protein